MNSRWTSRALALAALGLLAAACGRDRRAAPSGTPARPKPPAGQVAQQEATLLGREVFDLVDRLAAYAASNQRKYPTSLRDAGIDSLSSKVARTIDTKAKPPMGTAMFRNPRGHLLTSCRGTTDLLEESALHDGHFTVTCTDSLGQGSPYIVQRAAGH